MTTDIRMASLPSAVLLAKSDPDLQYTLRQSAAEYDKIGMRISTSNSKVMTLSLNKRGLFHTGNGKNSCFTESSGLIWI